MNRIKNIFAIVARVLSAIFAAVKWFSDDENRKHIDHTFDLATFAAVRVVRLYRDHASSIVLASKAISDAVEATEAARDTLMRELKEVGEKVVRDVSECERDMNEISRPKKNIREVRIAALEKARAAKAAKRAAKVPPKVDPKHSVEKPFVREVPLKFQK